MKFIYFIHSEWCIVKLKGLKLNANYPVYHNLEKENISFHFQTTILFVCVCGGRGLKTMNITN